MIPSKHLAQTNLLKLERQESSFDDKKNRNVSVGELKKFYEQMGAEVTLKKNNVYIAKGFLPDGTKYRYTFHPPHSKEVDPGAVDSARKIFTSIKLLLPKEDQKSKEDQK